MSDGLIRQTERLARFESRWTEGRQGVRARTAKGVLDLYALPDPDVGAQTDGGCSDGQNIARAHRDGSITCSLASGAMTGDGQRSDRTRHANDGRLMESKAKPCAQGLNAGG